MSSKKNNLRLNAAFLTSKIQHTTERNTAMSKTTGKIIGIDLGTTNSVVAVMEGNDPVVIANAEGARTTPSVVGFAKSGERLVGAAAKRQAVTNSQNTVYSIKRFMGRFHNEVNEEMKLVPYKVVHGENNTARVQIGDRVYSPPEISAMILQKMKQTAEDYLGAKITDAVGFRYQPQGQDYMHGAAITVISPKGKIARYLYGVDFLPLDVKLALTEASEGKSTPAINKLLKLCYSYDPSGRKYVLNITRIIGGGMILIIACFVLILTLRKQKSNHNNLPAQNGEGSISHG